MPTYYAYGEVVHHLYDANDNLIGYDTGHRPVYEIEANSLEEAEAAPLEDWEYTGDSNGTHGAIFDNPEHTYEDVEYEEIELEGISSRYGIELKEM